MQGLNLKLKALFILFSFLGIQLISIGCTLINFAHDLSNQIQSSQNHDHHSHQHSDQTDHHDDNENGTKCCDENSSIFFSKFEAIQVSLDLNLIPNAIDPIISLQKIKIAYNPVKFPINQIRPPPLLYFSSTSYRLVIQSFQI